MNTIEVIEELLRDAANMLGNVKLRRIELEQQSKIAREQELNQQGAVLALKGALETARELEDKKMYDKKVFERELAEAEKEEAKEAKEV